MRSLRKKPERVSYVESSGEEDFEGKGGNGAPAPKRRRPAADTAKRQRGKEDQHYTPDPHSSSDPSSDADSEPQAKRQRPGGDASSEERSCALSESGSDSEAEAEAARAPGRPEGRRRRAPPRAARKAPASDEEIDWSSLVQPPDDPAAAAPARVKEEEEDDEDDDDWEDVDAEEAEEPKPSPGLGPEGLVITVSTDVQRRKTAAPDLEAELRRELARARREAQEDKHVVHLLCLLAHGRRLSAACSEPEVAATAMSLLEAPPGGGGGERARAERLFAWACGRVRPSRGASASETVADDLVAQLLAVLGGGEAPTLKLQVLAVCALLRAAGLRVRLVHALHPTPLKPPPEGQARKTPGKGRARKSEPPPSDEEDLEEPRTTPKARRKAPRRKKAPPSDDEDFEEPRTTPKARRKAPRRKKAPPSDDEDFEEPRATPKGRGKGRAPQRDMARRKVPQLDGGADTESDEELEPPKATPRGSARKAPAGGKGTPRGGRPLLSEDEEEAGAPSRAAWWLELLCGQRWVVADCARREVDCPGAMEAPRHPQGLTYVVAFEAGGACKDVTPRYAARWCTLTRKLRLARDAWEEGVLAALSLDDRLLDAREDDEIRERLLALPPPRATGDFNNHPLYALTRHLKKYEVIYPPDAASLFFHKGEPVFPRDCVRTCHTRETWLKEARVVRLGEEPAKVVLSRTTSKQRVLLPNGQAQIELFGQWQTEDYDPPVARDGVVPKNEHGNVDLFQPRMLPVGCAHLRLPGLGRVARRLGIDVAQAMIGWEFHAGRWAHPVFDGWVVCREHVQALSHAWLEMERAAADKAAQRREHRALANWRLLVRGLLIRRRLQARYDLSGSAAASRVSSVARGMKGRALDA